MKANDKVRKSYVRPVLISAAIFSVLVLHFAVSQFIAYRERNNDVSVSEPVGASSAIIEVKDRPQKLESAIAAETFSSPAAPEPKVEARREVEKQTEQQPEQVNRKKAPRESRAERLRRAEKILTGI